MANRDDGGAAFPRQRLDWSDLTSDRPQLLAEHPGMTLRDYFAAKAMSATLSSPEWMLALREELQRRGVSTSDASGLAEFAYEAADAMLAERAK